MHKTLVLKPRVSEKTYALNQARNTYVFTVPLQASKELIARAIQAQFNVSVVSVNTTLIKGKAKRTIRKGGRPVTGKQSNFKKAYVTLKEGDTIPVFAAIEEAEKKATQADKEKK